jgi:hypothetical protein
MKKPIEFHPGDGTIVTSDNALLNLNRLLLVHGLPSLRKAWNMVYPNDPIDITDVANVYVAAMENTVFHSVKNPETCRKIIRDVRVLGLDDLANYVETLLREKGII